MKAFYKVTVTKQSVGSAIMHKEPPLDGEVVTKVTDTSTAGDFKLIVLDCTAEQHDANLTLSGVAEVTDKEAAELAPKYQPERTLTELDTRTGKEERVSIPAVDLRAFVGAREASAEAVPKKRAARRPPADLSGILESGEPPAEKPPKKKGRRPSD